MGRLAPALALVVLLVAGCGDSPDSGEDAAETESATTATVPQAAKPKDPPKATPLGRAEVQRIVDASFKYESTILSSLKMGPPPPDLEPFVVDLRYSGSDPRFAAAVVELRDSAGRGQPGTTVVVFRDKHIIAQTGTAFPVACTDGTPQGVRDLVCPNPWSAMDYPRPQIHLDRTVQAPAPVSDIRAVDWARATMPGAACASTEPLKMKGGVTRTRSLDDPFWAFIEAGVGKSKGAAAYGDLDGDGRDEAAIGVICTNGGGTAGGQLGFSAVVVEEKADALRLIGIVTPRQPLGPVGVHVPVFTVHDMEFRPGDLLVDEHWYGPRDGTCCSSGEASTQWLYRNGDLAPGETTVVKAPAT